MTATLIRIVGTHLPGRQCGSYRGVSVGLQVGKEVVGLVPGDAERAA